MSGASGASDVSGASGGAVDKRVEDLDVSDVLALFKRGDLTVSEMDKWLGAHSNVKIISRMDDDKTISYTFSYNNRTYSVACDKKASASQLDNITQQLYSKAYLTKKGLSEDVINKYFITAFAYNGV